MQLTHATWHPGGGAEPAPTLFAIHGHGAHAQDLLGLGPFLAAGRVQLICPEAEFVLQPGVLGYTWFDREPDGSRAPREFERVATLVSDFIDEASALYHADPERTALLGFSQGGGLAYRLGLAQPSRFAGVAALSTWLPDEAMAVADREHLGALPVLVQHGTADPMVKVERGRESRDRLAELGVTAEYREYPMQHQIGPESLRDLSEWLERVLRLPPPEAAAGS
jgi:phospholipase/carboxylesterase